MNDRGVRSRARVSRVSLAALVTAILSQQINLEFAYWIPLDKGWRLYAGAGPAANIYSFSGSRGTKAEGGVNFLVGTQHDGGLLLELKVGAADSPSLKVTVGFAIK